jgi:type I restriction enzyme, R subunit
MSNFAFLQSEWADINEPATKAEALASPDPRSSCFYARRALELAVQWLYKHDGALRLPYRDELSALLAEPTFKKSVGAAIFAKADLIRRLGNTAVHTQKRVSQLDALNATRELFHVLFWLARTYSRGARPADGLRFDAYLLPKTYPAPSQTLKQLQELETRLHERDEKLSQLLADKSSLDEELKRLRDEVTAAKAANRKRPDQHDYSEAETRDYFIDLLLKEVGWPLDQPRDREYPVKGMPSDSEEGFVDYVLWGDDGLPLAMVEAKRTRKDPRIGQRQAELYADCLEKEFGRRPIIFYSNGYDHWIWDDQFYPPRPVQGFYKKAELELLIQRRTSRQKLADALIDGKIAERYYQTRAIRRVGEAFETDRERKALLVMATGSGKTRTVVALCDTLMRANWAKRILFLADRVALVKQAIGVFKTFLPDASPVNLVTEKNAEGRVYVSTYPTMMGLIENVDSGQRRFGSGHFDLVIIDEAHRSVFQKYRAIFDYFDSLLVGLTATPKDEVDKNTYSLFELESGVPTDEYGLEQAVNDGFLVPPKAVSVPLKFQREGIKYKDLSQDEKEQWEALDWSDEGEELPDKVEAEAVNKWLFNKDTVDKVLEHLMTRGLKVAGGDKLGKTIVFAKNHAHAEFIAERFNANYPHYLGGFARVIDFQVPYAQSLIEHFAIPKDQPHIAISVDMLDTGIDVPEVVNLVFFKIVRSKTKFWQMLGRGTRLCKDLFGPGKDKEFFYIFDYCQNLEFFSENPEATDGSAGESLSTRLFKARLEVIGELDRGPAASQKAEKAEAGLRGEIAELLRMEVAAMNVENFVVRPKRRLVEKYGQAEVWGKLTVESHLELAREVAGLPSEQESEDEDAKRFDLLLLNLQLAVLRAEPRFKRLRKQVEAICGLLEEQASIPMVREQLSLIMELQTDEWWHDVTTPMLENARRRLRSLVKLIEKRKRQPVYSDFEDQMGAEAAVELPGFAAPDNFERFRAKARQFLKEHENLAAVRKLRMNQALAPGDLPELERALVESGVATTDDLTKAKEECRGLGLFVRSLVGLDREAAKTALARFIADKTLKANQIEFLNMIVDHLAEHGWIDAQLLYESPYTDFSPRGVEGVFTSLEVDELVEILNEIGQRALAA